MNKITPNHIILFGFIFGITVFALLNIFFPADGTCVFSTSCRLDGFPFTFYKSGYEDREGGDFIREILWFGLLADILIAIIFSFVLGLIFRLIWVNITSQPDSGWNKGIPNNKTAKL